MICYSRCIFHIARYGMPAWLPSAELYCWRKTVCIWDTTPWTSPKTLLLPYRYRDGQEEVRQSDYPILWYQYWHNFRKLFYFVASTGEAFKHWMRWWRIYKIYIFIYLFTYLFIYQFVCLSTFLHAIVSWYTLSYMFRIKKPSSGRITQDKREIRDNICLHHC
jgi:hypothetical protein